jgi:UDP:flavonoid glycosyltransferase YjiC (YdhE family)
MRALVSAGFFEGHAYPALALARALRARGHEVHVGLSARWRETIEGLELGFVGVEEYAHFPQLAPGRPRSVVDAARELEAAIRESRPDVVVADVVSPAPALAAELAGVPLATLVATVYPVPAAGLPPFPLGLRAPRTPAGAALWRASAPLTRRLLPSDRWLARVPGLLDEIRAELGLGPARRDPERTTTYGIVSEELTLVATFPQLEYPRRWPANVHVTGPMLFELPHPEVELPAGDEPLVLVAPSTVAGGGRDLVAAALEALAGEPVRVMATLNRASEGWHGEVPANARVVDWISYAQVMPLAALAITGGGQGTVTRALADATPVIVSPGGADTAENGARVSWAGAGVAVPRRIAGPGTLRHAARRVLGNRGYAARAAELARWAHDHDGAARGAELVEAYASPVAAR